MARHEIMFNTNLYSASYIQINCCGWMDTVKGGGLTKRPFGRSDYQILYIYKGSMLMEDTEYKAGSVVLYKPKEKQIYFSTSSETTYYWIHFSGYLADEFFENYPSRLIKTNCHASIMRFIENTVNTSNSLNPPTDRYVEAELLCLLNKIIGEKAQNNIDFRVITPAIIYMNENYTEALSNEEYARMCGMSKFHFIRKFSELVEMSPQKYRIKIVLEKSLELLSESDDKISAIANSLGFYDYMYFSKRFKSYFNMTPSEYRNAVRTKSDINGNEMIKNIFFANKKNPTTSFADKTYTLSDVELKIINYIEINPKASTSVIAEELNLNLRTVQRAINTLKIKDIIRNDGNRKNNRWRLLHNTKNILNS